MCHHNHLNSYSELPLKNIFFKYEVKIHLCMISPDEENTTPNPASFQRSQALTAGSTPENGILSTQTRLLF